VYANNLPLVSSSNYILVPGLGTKTEYVSAKVSDHITTLESFPQNVPRLGTKSGNHGQSGKKVAYTKACLHTLHTLNTVCIHQAQMPMYTGVPKVSVCSVCKKIIIFLREDTLKDTPMRFVNTGLYRPKDF